MAASDDSGWSGGWRVLAVLAAVLVALWPTVYAELFAGDASEVLGRLTVSGPLDLAAVAAEVDGVGRWQPLTVLAWKAGHALGGGGAAGFHALSLAVHLAATAAAFLLVRRMTSSSAMALGAALVFGLHPLQVESVAVVGALARPLSSMFAFLACYAWLGWRARGSRAVPLGASLAFLAALAADELALAVPLLVVAIDLGRTRAQDGRSAASVHATTTARGLAGRLLPARGFAALAGVLLVVWAARAVAYGGPTAGLELARFDYGVPDARLAWLRPELVGGTLALLAWPFGMDFVRPFEPSPAFASRAVLLPLAAIGVALAGLFACVRTRARTPLGALAWVFAALIPVALRLRTLGEFPLADRWAYAAVLGWAMLVAWAALRLLPRAVAWSALALLALAYGTESHARSVAFRDDEAFLRSAQGASAQTPALEWRLGRTLLKRYDETHDPALLREALDRFQHTLDLLQQAQRGDRSIYVTREDHVQANLGLAWCLLYEARVDEYHDFASARGVFDLVAKRYPGTVEALHGRAAAEAEEGDLDAAAVSLEQALELAPDAAETHHRLGRVRMLQGRWDDAAAAFERALALRPNDVNDLCWRARADAEAGHTDEAMTFAARAHELHPHNPEPLVIQGTLLAARGELEPALALARRATALAPDDGEALLLRGKLHAALGQREQATAALQRACDRLPQSFEAHYNAAALLLERGSVDEALPYLSRAYRLRANDASGAQLRQTLLALDIASPEILLALAEEDRRRGQTNDALVWSERALALRPDLVDAQVLRAMILGEQGQLEPAAQALTAVSTANPDHLEAHVGLGRFQALLGHDAEARAAFERALVLAQREPMPATARASLEERLHEALGRLGASD